MMEHPMIPNARAAILAQYGFARNVGEVLTDFTDKELERLCKDARRDLDRLLALANDIRLLRGKRHLLREVLGKLDQKYDKSYDLFGPDDLERLIRRKEAELERDLAFKAQLKLREQPT